MAENSSMMSSASVRLGRRSHRAIRAAWWDTFAHSFRAGISSRAPVFIPSAQRRIEDPRGVAITFDDGPHEPATREALGVLREESLTATFFLMGRSVETFPRLARMCVEEGHAIGNHGYDHARHDGMHKEDLRRSIERTNDAVMRAAGVRPRCFRPPYGRWKRSANPVLEELGMRLVLWDCMPMDFILSTPLDIIHRFLATRLQGGSIIALHDNGKTAGRIATIVRMLAEIVREKGLHTVILP